jgi:hypothetical protein
MLDLYVCLRPVRWFKGVPSPVKHPERTDMVIFRENTEDIYAGIEWAAGTPEAQRVIRFLQDEMGVRQIRFPATSSLGIKPVSREGTARLVRLRSIDGPRRIERWLEASSADPAELDTLGDAFLAANKQAMTLEVDAPEAELALTVQLTRDRVGLSGMSVDVDEPDEGLSGLEVVFTAPANDTIGTITQPVPLTGAGVAVLLEGDQGLPLTVAGDWTMTVNAVTPTGIFTSPPQGFTILNADGTEAVTELTVPPAVNVTIPPLTSEP